MLQNFAGAEFVNAGEYTILVTGIGNYAGSTGKFVFTVKQNNSDNNNNGSNNNGSDNGNNSNAGNNNGNTNTDQNKNQTVNNNKTNGNGSAASNKQIRRLINNSCYCK